MYNTTISPTGRRNDHRRHLLSVAQAQMLAMQAPVERKSVEDRALLAIALQMQNALLRKDLTAEMAQALLKTPSPTLPAQDFTSIEQRIAGNHSFDVAHPVAA